MEEENQTVDLAYELIKELSNANKRQEEANKRQEKQNKRCYVISLIILVGWISTIMAGFYVFQLYDYSSETILDAGEGGNAYYTEKGDINNNGENQKNNKDD
jgi:F0F1-type ATP synthase assembly protein I